MPFPLSKTRIVPGPRFDEIEARVSRAILCGNLQEKCNIAFPGPAFVWTI